MSSISSTWIIIGVLVVLVVWIIMIYNGLVAMRQRVNQSFADIDVQLKQRSDLILVVAELGQRDPLDALDRRARRRVGRRGPDLRKQQTVVVLVLRVS